MSTSTNKRSTNCTCGLSNPISCPKCSVVKMVILLKNGQDQYKIGKDKKVNPVWYSYLKYNRYDSNRIADKMEHRLRNHKIAMATQEIRFYEKGAKTHFRQVTI